MVCAHLGKINNKADEAEKSQLVSELNSELAKFTDDQKEVAKAQIEAFNANPVKTEINSIVAAIKIAIADKQMEAAKVLTEQNSRKERDMNIDIFGSIDSSLFLSGQATLYRSGP